MNIKDLGTTWDITLDGKRYVACALKYKPVKDLLGDIPGKENEHGYLVFCDHTETNKLAEKLGGRLPTLDESKVLSDILITDKFTNKTNCYWIWTSTRYKNYTRFWLRSVHFDHSNFFGARYHDCFGVAVVLFAEDSLLDLESLKSWRIEIPDHVGQVDKTVKPKEKLASEMTMREQIAMSQMAKEYSDQMYIYYGDNWGDYTAKYPDDKDKYGNWSVSFCRRIAKLKTRAALDFADVFIDVKDSN